jgi:hypothetical protein
MDPFNANRSVNNTTVGKRGFNNTTYKPSEYELTQMAAFDHIVTQGRLLRVQTDPYPVVNLHYPTAVTIAGYNDNPGFGSVVVGGTAPFGEYIIKTSSNSGNPSKYTENTTTMNFANVAQSVQYTLSNESNTTLPIETFYLDEMTATPNTAGDACAQRNSLFGYGLTLINFERYLLDQYFQGMFNYVVTEGLFTNSVSKITIENGTSSTHTNIKINLIVKTKNATKNGQPYEATLQLNIRNQLLIDDKNQYGIVDSFGSGKGWGHVDNISPIIERM